MVKKTENVNAFDFESQIECSVNTLLELHKSTKKKNILIDNGQTIFLQVTIFKIPQLNEFIKRKIVLKHPTFGGIPEVCLIVKDFINRDKIKRTGDEMIDISIERFEKLLKKHKVTGITNIMPYYQLKMEYNTFELKRKLADRFDMFICQSYLFGRDHFFDCFGKIFINKNKYPIAVKLPEWNANYDPKFNKRIQSAIASTVFYVKPSSDNYSIRIGNTNNKKEDIIENLKVVIDKIMKSNDFIPGGFQNVRLINIKTERSKAVPLYISLSSGNDIPVPHVASNVPSTESVEGEISTLPGRKVKVLPTGDVFVTQLQQKNKFKRKHKIYKQDQVKSANNKSLKKESKIKIGKEKIEKKSVIKKKKIIKDEDGNGNDNEDAVNGNKVNEFSDIEDAIESVEQKYLSNLNDQFENSEDEKKEKKKNLKGTKRKLKEKARPSKKMKKEKPIKTKLKEKIVKNKKMKLKKDK